MTREELFEYIEKIDDPAKDYGKILSNLHFTHFHLMDHYKQINKSYNLTFTQSNVLAIISHSHPKPLALEEIKAMVLEPNADVSRTVVRLTEKGFVEKVTDKTNRRKVSIKATPAGMKMIKKMESDSRFGEITKELSLKEAKNFVGILKKLRKD